MKCKDCGAHLPYGAYGQIRCEFCNAPNYVPIPGGEAEEKKEAKVESAVEKTTESIYATFGSRFWAYMIDVFILLIVQFIFRFSYRPLLSTLINVAYFTYFFGTTGQTPGKKWMKIKVVSTDGSPMTLSKGFKRYLGYLVSGITIGVGFLWIIWDKDKQGFEDKIAKTYVIKT